MVGCSTCSSVSPGAPKRASWVYSASPSTWWTCLGWTKIWVKMIPHKNMGWIVSHFGKLRDSSQSPFPSDYFWDGKNLRWFFIWILVSRFIWDGHRCTLGGHRLGQGSLSIRSGTLQIRIPPGVQPGQVFLGVKPLILANQLRQIKGQKIVQQSRHNTRCSFHINDICSDLQIFTKSTPFPS